MTGPTNNPANEPARVVPLPGPLEVDPTSAVYALAAGPGGPRPSYDAVAELADAMLAAGLADVERGAWDEQVIAWLATKDVATVATLASWLRRCWQAGAAAGRAEIGEERPAALALDEIAVAAAEVEARFDAERVSGQDAFERLLGAVRSAIGGLR